MTIDLNSIKYDTPVEVSKAQYTRIMTDLAGVCAGREENGKYYIKVLLVQYMKYVKAILTKS